MDRPSHGNPLEVSARWTPQHLDVTDAPLRYAAPKAPWIDGFQKLRPLVVTDAGDRMARRREHTRAIVDPAEITVLAAAAAAGARPRRAAVRCTPCCTRCGRCRGASCGGASLADGTIIAIGGGGFMMRGVLSPLHRYVLAAARRKRPRVCFIGSAAGDPGKYVRRFYRAFGDVRCVASHLDVFSVPLQGVEAFLAEQDVVYVGGGNTRNLLLLWRAWGIDRALRKAYADGTVLAGVSAGALCWFREGTTDSWPGRLEPLRCLGLVDASFSPHYDAEPGRRPTFQRLIARGRLGAGYAADDGVGLRFEGGTFREAVAEERGKSGYHVARTATGVHERVLPTRLLR